MARPSRPRERLVALFLLGVIAFSPPLLTVFNVPTRVAGVPGLYLYLFAAWLVIIVLAAVAVERGHSDVDLAANDRSTAGLDEDQKRSGA